MKAHIAHVLESIHGQSRNRQNEVHVRTLQSENMQLQRTLQAKENEIAELRRKLDDLEIQLQETTGVDGLTGLPNRHSFKQHLLRSVKRAAISTSRTELRKMPDTLAKIRLPVSQPCLSLISCQ